MMRVLTAALLSGFCLAAAPALAQVNLNDWLGEAENAPPAAATPSTESAPAAGGDTATRLQAAAREVEQAVALVVRVEPAEQGFRPVPFGTAWAFEPSRLGTNAHITQYVARLLEAGIGVHVLPNRSRGESFRVTRAVSHPRFGENQPNAHGRLPVGGPYDVGILEIDGRFPATVRLADGQLLQALGGGTPLAYVGFPMESLAGDNVNLANPIATMQTGIVSGVSDFYLEDGGPGANLLIRHNLPATGGASGSAVFTTDGRIVGTLNGGNVNLVEFTTESGTRQFRVPSAAQINYAQRIDILADIIDR